jgi:predicted Ser/Thr protein kinase
MEMTKKQLTNAIEKLITVIKPVGVSDVTFSLEEMGIREKEYYMFVRYIVPDDSVYLNSSTIDERVKWNNELRKSIKNYFNADVIINSTSITSQSHYNKQKEK